MIIHEESLRLGIQFALGSQGIWTPELEELIVEEVKKAALSKLHQATVSDLVCDNCGNDFFVTTIGGNKKCHRCGKAIKHT